MCTRSWCIPGNLFCKYMSQVHVALRQHRVTGNSAAGFKPVFRTMMCFAYVAAATFLLVWSSWQPHLREKKSWIILLCTSLEDYAWLNGSWGVDSATAKVKGDAGPDDNVPIVLLLQCLLSLNGQLQKIQGACGGKKQCRMDSCRSSLWMLLLQECYYACNVQCCHACPWQHSFLLIENCHWQVSELILDWWLMPWHGVVLPFSLQQRVAEIFGTNNSNNNNAFCGNKKIYVTKKLASKMKVPGRGKGKGWRMMGFSLELRSKLLAPMMIRPTALKFIAMEMGSLELVGNVIGCIFYVVADQDLVLDKQGIEGSQILAIWEIFKVKAGGCVKVWVDYAKAMSGVLVVYV